MAKLKIKAISGNRAVAESGEIIRFPVNVNKPIAGDVVEVEAVFIVGKEVVPKAEKKVKEVVPKADEPK